MSLLVYNLTAAPLVLANGLGTTIPASTAGAGVRGEPWYASGAELNGRSVPEYTALQAQQDAGLVAFEWQAFEEYPTYPLLVASAQTDVYGLPFQIYVNATTGNDNNPGTATSPMQTLEAAWKKLPAILTGTDNRVFLSADNFDISAGLRFPSVGHGGTGLVVIGTPIDQIGPRVAALASTDTAYVCTVDPVIADGSLEGAFLRNTSTGDRITVTGNTTVLGVCTINVLKPGIFVTSGDTFVVERPGSSIRPPQFGVVAITEDGGFRDVKIVAQAEAGFGLPLLLFGGFMFFEAVEIDGGTSGRGVIAPHNSRLVYGLSGPWSADTNPPFSNQRYLANFYLHSAGPFGMYFISDDQTSLEIAPVLNNVFVGVSNNSNAYIESIHATLMTMKAEYQSAITIRQGNVLSDLGFAAGTINAERQSQLTLGWFGQSLDISNSIGHGAAGDTMSNVDTVELTGTGNAGHGLAAANASLIRTFLGGTLITGAGGDVLVGAVTKAYGALPFSEVDGSGPTGNRAQ